MSTHFAEDVVLVTGAAGLIGSAVATAFLDAGARVAAVDAADPEPATGAAVVAPTAAPGRLLSLREDLTDPGAPERAVAAARDALGVPTVVVNAAAVHGRGPFLALDAAHVDRVLAVNVRATLLVARAAADAMIAAGVPGRIVNLSSISATVSHGESVAYEASKGAVTMATRALANVLAPHGIRVNAVAPGVMVKAQELDRVREPGDLDADEALRIPLRRAGTAEEIARAVLFLASADAAYVTGEVLHADGGALAVWAAAGPAGVFGTTEAASGDGAAASDDAAEEDATGAAGPAGAGSTTVRPPGAPAVAERPR